MSDARLEIDYALDAAEDDGYPTGKARDALADLVAEVKRLREENAAWRRGECTCRDDHASWCPVYRVERLREALLNAAETLDDHGAMGAGRKAREAASVMTALPADAEEPA